MELKKQNGSVVEVGIRGAFIVNLIKRKLLSSALSLCVSFHWIPHLKNQVCSCSVISNIICVELHLNVDVMKLNSADK